MNTNIARNTSFLSCLLSKIILQLLWPNKIDQLRVEICETKNLNRTQREQQTEWKMCAREMVFSHQSLAHFSGFAMAYDPQKAPKSSGEKPSF